MVSLVGIYSRAIKIYVTKGLYVNIHDSFSHSSLNWKQSKRPTIGEWINKLYIHKLKNYIAIKRDNHTDKRNSTVSQKALF